MNPAEIYEFLTKLLRETPEIFVALVMGAVAGALLAWKFVPRDKESQKKLADVQEKLATEVGRRTDAESRLYTKENGLAADLERELRAKLTQAEEDIRQGTIERNRLSQERQTLFRLVQKWKPRIEMLQTENAEYRAALDRVRHQLRPFQERLREVIEQCGRAWERPVALDAFPFVPRAERECSILSLINLKGGVGKTTLTLNIAATLAGRGKRVLLVDLDHQRSLSHLCLRTKERNQVSKSGRALQHFLFRPANRTPQFFASCIEPVNGIANCSIVINSDPSESDFDDDGVGLASVEDFLWLQYVVGMGKTSDVRLFLREALHDPSISEKYDFILLDCPPRLTTGTIDALAASDFVIIPVELDAIAGTNPTPHLLRELRRLGEDERFPNFSVLGIIANKVQMRGDKILGDQASVLEGLSKIGLENWGKSVPVFRTLVNDVIAFSKAAKVLVEEKDSTAVVHSDKKVKEIFINLVEELEERIAHESQHLATVRS